MSAPLLYVTGTNTGVGKTTLARLLLLRARERNVRIAAMKPFCSGGREDAEQLHDLQTAGLALDEVNPFFFRAPLAPYVAGQNEKRTITPAQTIASIQQISTRGAPLLIEGAGGLMSPLGEHFTLLDIIGALSGRVCVVGANMLGVINSALLTHRALRSINSEDMRFVLMNSAEPDASAASNPDVIAKWTGAPAHEFPFLRGVEAAPEDAVAISSLDSLLDWWLKGG